MTLLKHALADFVQDDLFAAIEPDRPTGPAALNPGLSTPDQHAASSRTTPSTWRPGQDILHNIQGPGWVWGAGRGLVTVRFEGATTGPGPIRTFAAEDPDLLPADPPDWA